MASTDPRPAIAAVLFDLDGVITDTAEQHYQAWQRLADEEGLPFDRAANEALRGVSRRESLALILGEAEVTDEQREEMMARKNDYYVASLAELSPSDALPGARALVTDCRARGLRVAVASSSRNARTVLDALEMTEEFDAIADGASVEHAKPAPDLFLHAASLVDVAPACVRRPRGRTLRCGRRAGRRHARGRHRPPRARRPRPPALRHRGRHRPGRGARLSSASPGGRLGTKPPHPASPRRTPRGPRYETSAPRQPAENPQGPEVRNLRTPRGDGRRHDAGRCRGGERYGAGSGQDSP
jgi:beta-phosphoglucomutase